MTGWLEAFRDEGLLDWSRDSAYCTLTASGRAMSSPTAIGSGASATERAPSGVETAGTG